MKVVIIEKSFQFREFIKIALRETGFLDSDIFEFESEEEAAKIFGKRFEDFDLILKNFEILGRQAISLSMPKSPKNMELFKPFKKEDLKNAVNRVLGVIQV
jgi:hypothetical protein